MAAKSRSSHHNAFAMTPGGSVFWIFLFAYFNLSGISGLVLGLIARFAVRLFETPGRTLALRLLMVVVGLIAILSSALSYNLASRGGAAASLRATSLITPLLAGPVLFGWASGFPLSRVFRKRS